MTRIVQKHGRSGLGSATKACQTNGRAQAASALYVEPTDGRLLHVVLVSPLHVPAWISTTLELASQSPQVAISVVPVDVSWAPSVPRLPLDMRVFLDVEQRLLRWFLRMTGRDYRGPMTGVSINLEDGGDSRPRTRPATAGDIGSLCRQVQAMEPDLVILHGPRQWAEALAACAVHGCWRLDESLVEPAIAGVALIKPILDKQDASAFTLQLQVEGQAPMTLAESWGATRAVSFSQQRDLAFRKLPAMLLRGLRKLSEDAGQSARGVAACLRVAQPERPFPASAGLRAFAITLKMIRHWRTRRYHASRPWFVVLREEPGVIDTDAPCTGQVRSLVAPGNDYWADPFPFFHDGRKWLMVEEFIAAVGKGVIRLLELLPDGNVIRHGIVLEEPFHLSFPQVWGVQGEWWMTVESADGGKASLYRSNDLFGGWQCVTDLIQGRECVDPTLFEHAGHWYLFVNIAESGGNPSDELFLFTAHTMQGPYQPHPANPIVSDVRQARMAGRIFIDVQGRLIRPAQCCAPIYGSAVVFNEIIELTPSSYRERVLSRLDMSHVHALDGCHTYNECGGIELLDMHGEPPPHAERAVVVDRDGTVIST